MLNSNKLFDLMTDKGFQEPRTGNLFFPVYIYTYEPAEEYEMRKEISLLIEKLERPNNYLDSLVINMYDEMIEYLKEEQFANRSLFDLISEKEKEDDEEALTWVRDEINEGNFYNNFTKKVKNHFGQNNEKKVYLVLHGFGTAYPYLRVSDFLKNTEQLIKEFKVIVFYPGNYDNNNYNMFGLLNDDNLYRANHLNKYLAIE
ncbi:BREX protein BrxB domain-containing protein [Flavobacterium magnesitis]|uniref:BREX protein BrxB domain-containing protein n=1 Tax=Flavobacterium magnesitis TaxID=3138077 RepID=UPI00358EC236